MDTVFRLVGAAVVVVDCNASKTTTRNSQGSEEGMSMAV